MKVLVLENSKLYQQLLDDLLTNMGHRATTVSNAHDGFQALQEYEFDAICVSMHLSDMSGIEFTMTYRKEHTKQLPIILITSETDDELLKSAMELGITDICAKKDMDDFTKKIACFMDNMTGFGAKNIAEGRVLYVEDSMAVAQMTISLLDELNLHVRHFTSASDAYELLTEEFFDLVITDIVVEGSMTGLGLTRAIRNLSNNNQNVPILAMTGFDDSSRRLELFRAGVNDYTTKPIINEEFLARVTNLVSNKLLFDQVNEQQNRLYALAMSDQLTGCNNRHALNEFAPKYLAEALRHNHHLSLMVIDLDHFKKINDKHGHDVGDIVLSAMGKLLNKESRDEDFVARIGGEEFVILLPYCDLDEAMLKADTLRQTIEDSQPNGLLVTASIGVTAMQKGQKVEFFSLFKAADRAVYMSKEGGRNCVTRHEPTIAN